MYRLELSVRLVPRCGFQQYASKYLYNPLALCVLGESDEFILTSHMVCFATEEESYVSWPASLS